MLPRGPTVKETTNILNYANDNKVAKCPLRSAATPTIDLIRTIEDESLVPPENLLTQIKGSITLISSIKLLTKCSVKQSK
jgi:methenyltetrahydromethanopterin cyclohydrolase